jgi:hypothetical protein
MAAVQIAVLEWQTAITRHCKGGGGCKGNTATASDQGSAAAGALPEAFHAAVVIAAL